METPEKTRTLVDAALAVVGHGFASQFGSMDGPVGWHGLAEVSPVILDNLGEDDLAKQYRMAIGDNPYTAWVHTNEAGDDHIVTAAEVGSAAERRILDAFDALAEQETVMDYVHTDPM